MLKRELTPTELEALRGKLQSSGGEWPYTANTFAGEFPVDIYDHLDHAAKCNDFSPVWLQGDGWSHELDIYEIAVEAIMRYEVIQGSESNHCCFRWTVIDRQSGEKIGEHWYAKSMCECFEKEDADEIAVALNRWCEETK